MLSAEVVLDRDEDVENAIIGDRREQGAAGWWGTIRALLPPAPLRARQGLLRWNGMQNKNCIELRSFLAWCVLGKEGFLFFPWDIQKFKIRAFHWGEQHGRAAQAGVESAVNFAFIFFPPYLAIFRKEKKKVLTFLFPYLFVFSICQERDKIITQSLLAADIYLPSKQVFPFLM